MADALVAYVHFAAMIVIAVALAIEYLVCAPGMGSAGARLLARTDLVYLGAAAIALTTGVARVLWFGKGAAFYLGNPVFYIKLALFVAVGLISLPPTLQFLRWARALRAGPGSVVPDYEVFRTRRYLLAEICLFALIPLMAVLMARGIGIQVSPD